jgi:hypothetical protein
LTQKNNKNKKKKKKEKKIEIDSHLTTNNSNKGK